MTNTQEKLNGNTPNGGTYSIAYFQDAEGQPTTKSTAKKMEIIEFDSKDNEIFRTYAQTRVTDKENDNL